MSKKLLQVAMLAAAVGVDIDSCFPKPKKPKPMDKYGEEAILKNEIKQAMKAAKRLARRQHES